MGLEARKTGSAAPLQLPPGRSAAGSVTVRFFSTSRDVTGEPSARVDIESGETLASLLARLVTAWPPLGALVPSLLVAVNYEYSEPSRILEGGEEVALIPPVAGG